MAETIERMNNKKRRRKGKGKVCHATLLTRRFTQHHHEMSGYVNSISFKNDSDNLISIFKVLHPQYKCKYFENAGWTSAWIKTARTIVCDEYMRSYEAMVVENLKADESEHQKVS